MSNKYLLNIGYGKCGTTLIENVIRSHFLFNVPAEKKEIKYFEKHTSMDDYISLFREGECKYPSVYFESSPPYLTGKSFREKIALIKKIKESVGDPHILLAIRHPLTRAYSHYVHNLQSYAMLGAFKHRKVDRRDLLTHPLYVEDFSTALISQPSLAVNYYEDALAYFDVFGVDNVSFFFLEQDGKNLNDFFVRLLARLGFGSNQELAISNERVFEGSEAPLYLSGLTDDGVQAGLAKDEFKIKSYKGEITYNKIKGYEARRLLAAEQRWTKFLSANDQEQIYDDVFRKDFELFLDLLEHKGFDAKKVYANFKFKDKSIARS